jgi:co-chaperonin GroES (HSP10)
MSKDIILVGDRVLIEPDEAEDKTDTGLYLPQGIKEREKVQAGRVVKAGPGYPVPDPSLLEQKPWERVSATGTYFPLQAQEGDYCIFLRDQGVEIRFEGKRLIVVPHSSIIALIRDSIEEQLKDI